MPSCVKGYISVSYPQLAGLVAAADAKYRFSFGTPFTVVTTVLSSVPFLEASNALVLILQLSQLQIYCHMNGLEAKDFQVVIAKLRLSVSAAVMISGLCRPITLMDPESTY